MRLTTSWDDGHRLDAKLADLMARYGISGTFYCPMRNDKGEPVLDPAAMRPLVGGLFEVASHTLDHIYVNRVSPSQWQAQVIQGKAELESILGHAVEGFGHPGGKLTSSSRATVVEAGFVYARIIENLRCDCGSDPFLMPASLQFYPHRCSVLARNVLRRGGWGKHWALAAACMGECDFEPRLRAVLERCRGADTVFHLLGHSWEIERNGLWPALERFFALLDQTVPKGSRFTNAGLLRAQGLLR